MMSTESRPSAPNLTTRAALESKPIDSSDPAIPRDLSRTASLYDIATARSSPERKRQRYMPESTSFGTVSTTSQTEPSNESEVNGSDQLDDVNSRQKSNSIGSESRGSHLAQNAPRRASPNHVNPERRVPAIFDAARRDELRDGLLAPRFYEDRQYEGDSTIASERRRSGGHTSEQYHTEMERRDRTYRDAAPTSRMPPPVNMLETRSPETSHRLPSMQQRASSPPPRLPGFASLHAEGNALRNRDDTAAYVGNYPTSPRRSTQPGYRQVPHASYASNTSRPFVAHQSSSSSTPFYGNPPMIHPSLAGLPGAGGGPGGKQQPSFVSKLYSMLEDPSIGDLISWGHTGTVFSVANPTEFSRLILPNWFKHSNWQSFVRQLNMYGFHKVNHSYQGNPNDEVQVWEFRHPSFRRGELALLNDIKRKSSRQKRTGSPPGSMNGGDMRADRSGGSTSSSPEVPTTLPANGPDGIRMGLHRAPREYTYGDDRVSSHGLDRWPDQRGASYDQVTLRHASGDPRCKAEESPSGIAGPSMAQPVMPGQSYSPENALRRRADPYIDRDEAAARFEDLSERTDAIIRHASFLESQLRMLSDQLNDTRAASRQLVHDEMLQLLDRLERSLSAPAQPGIDTSQRMLEVIRKQISFYSSHYGPLDDSRQAEAALMKHPKA